MTTWKYNKSLYSKTALIKAAYNFTDSAYIHLDADDKYYYVTLNEKEGCFLKEEEFVNEMLAQSVRHEIYRETKNIRELLLARAMGTSVLVKDSAYVEQSENMEEFVEEDILKDWFK